MTVSLYTKQVLEEMVCQVWSGKTQVAYTEPKTDPTELVWEKLDRSLTGILTRPSDHLRLTSLMLLWLNESQRKPFQKSEDYFSKGGHKSLAI